MQNRETLRRLLAVLCLVFALTAYLAALARAAAEHRAEERLQAVYEQLLTDRGELRARLALLDEDEELEALAREELGLVKPGEKIFYFD